MDERSEKKRRPEQGWGRVRDVRYNLPLFGSGQENCDAADKARWVVVFFFVREKRVVFTMLEMG